MQRVVPGLKFSMGAENDGLAPSHRLPGGLQTHGGPAHARCGHEWAYPGDHQKHPNMLQRFYEHFTDEALIPFLEHFTWVSSIP